MLVFYLLLPVFLDAIVATPFQVDDSIYWCRANATNSIEECACFPECTVVSTNNSFAISMGNISSFARDNRIASGCGNPQAHVLVWDTVVNMGSTPPFNILSQTFQACTQHACDVNPITVPTILIAGQNTIPHLSTANIVSHGSFRDWPDRDAACASVRATSQGGANVQYRTPYVHCRPGVDCDAPNPIPQYYQHDHYRLDHWNDCGFQAYLEVEISVDAVTPNTSLCSLVLQAMGIALSTVAPEFEWLFGKMNTACKFI